MNHKKIQASGNRKSIPEKENASSGSSLEEPSKEINSSIVRGRTIQYLASIAFFILVIVSSLGIFLLSNRI